MRLFIKSILLFVLILLVVNYPVAYYIKNHFYIYSKQNWILNKTNLKLDYAVLGSSRVFYTIDIASLDKTYGKKGINIGTSGGSYGENYIILSEFISKNKISNLLLLTDEFCFNSPQSYPYPFHEYEFLNLFNKYDSVFFDFIPKWKFYLWKTVPVAKYCEFNKQLNLKKLPQTSLDETMGTELITDKDCKKLTLDPKDQISEIDKKYFLKIIELCTANNIKIIFINTPIYTFANRRINKAFKTYIDSISSSKKIPYYDFKGMLNSDDVKYFRDKNHTNSLGSIEYSINLGKKLKNSN